MQQKSVLILRKIFHLFVICLVVVTALTFVAIQNKKTNINSLNGNVKAGIHYLEYIILNLKNKRIRKRFILSFQLDKKSWKKS